MKQATTTGCIAPPMGTEGELQAVCLQAHNSLCICVYEHTYIYLAS